MERGPPRQRITSEILDLLNRSYKTQLKNASGEVFASLALKIERMMHRTFPNNDGMELSPEILERQMRYVIERILYSKESVALQPNNYSDDDLDDLAADSVHYL